MLRPTRWISRVGKGLCVSRHEPAGMPAGERSTDLVADVEDVAQHVANAGVDVDEAGDVDAVAVDRAIEDVEQAASDGLQRLLINRNEHFLVLHDLFPCFLKRT